MKNKQFIISALLCIHLSLWTTKTAIGETESGNGKTTADQFAQTVRKGSEIELFVTNLDDGIVVDGKLDDAERAKAVPYEASFFQQEPYDRMPSREKTRVMVLQNNDVIYFGIFAYHTDPGHIFAAGMRRDKDIMSGDNVELLIDTFRDNRTCYALSPTPSEGNRMPSSATRAMT